MCLVAVFTPLGLACAADQPVENALTAGKFEPQSAKKKASSIKLKPQTKAYTGKKLAYTGKVTRSLSKGKVTFKYYKDRACTRVATPKAAGTYYVRATMAADALHKAAKSNVVRFTIAKAKNTLAVHVKAQGIYAKALESKAKTVSVLAVSKAQGKKSFKVAKWATKKANKYL